MTTQHHPRPSFPSWTALLCLLSLLAIPQGRADEWFLRVEGVPGELQEGPLAGWTPVQIAGAIATGAVDPATGTPTPASFSCELRKAVDVVSAKLIASCASGTALPRVTLASIQNQPRATHYRITLDNVMVASVMQEGLAPGAASPQRNERVKLTFDRIETATFEVDPNGGTAGGLASVFDLTTGQGELKSRDSFRIQMVRENGDRSLTVMWPAWSGHRYDILGCTALGQPWTRLGTFEAQTDGMAREVIPVNVPMTFLRVEEID